MSFTNDGQFVISWMEMNMSTLMYHTYVRRFNSLGQAQGGDVEIGTGQAASNLTPTAPSIGASNSGFVVTWSQKEAASGFCDVMARKYNWQGVQQ